MYKHCQEFNHSINFNNPKILITNRNVRSRRFLESFFTSQNVSEFNFACNFQIFMSQLLLKYSITSMVTDKFQINYPFLSRFIWCVYNLNCIDYLSYSFRFNQFRCMQFSDIYVPIITQVFNNIHGN